MASVRSDHTVDTTGPILVVTMVRRAHLMTPESVADRRRAAPNQKLRDSGGMQSQTSGRDDATSNSVIWTLRGAGLSCPAGAVRCRARC
jgi:hypothetical protein